MLSIHNRSKTYRNGVRALHDVSLEIPKGMFGLLGPNGAGKSTLMRTIATLQAPDSGTIAFDGVDVLSQPELLRRQLGYAPQEFGVYPRISGRAMLAPKSEVSIFPWKEPTERIPLAVRLIHSFLKAHRPA
jgi:ABC-type multidrug transport system ATPase subunit